MKKITFELIPFSQPPEEEGQYIVQYKSGNFEICDYITMYGKTEWRDLHSNILIFTPFFWLKEIK